MEANSLFQIAPFLKIFVPVLVHLNKGNPVGSDHIKSIVPFCPSTVLHSLQHTSDYFDYPCTKGSNAIQRCSVDIILHIPPTGINLRASYQGGVRARRFVHHDQSICYGIFHQKMSEDR